MWFKLASATFTNHLGSMDSLSNTWSIQYQLSGGLSRGTSPTSVTKGSSASITLTLSSGATYNNDLSVTVGGTAVSVTPSISGSTISFTLSAVSGAVVIKASATGSNVDNGDGDSGSGGGSTTPDTLNEIAWEDMTYYDLFINNNRAPDINNNSMTNAYGNNTYTNSTGSVTIVSDSAAADNYVPPYSLYVTGTSSQQAKSSKNYASTTSYFLAANIKVTDYTQGYCGIIFGSQFGACASAVTDGYEVFSFIGDNTAASTSSTALFIGSASSANLTGYINNPVAIDMSIFTTAPSLEELTTLYKNYTAKLIAG